MKISVAMATYNGAKYLQEQLDSFVAQTRQPDELVVTDDCSTDDTVGILEAFAASAPFEVIFERNERNYGYAGNFNRALVKTSGDLVFFSDQDDLWFPEKIERMTDIAIGNPHAWVVMNDAAITDADLKDSGLTKLGQFHSAGLKDTSFVMGCCAAVKRDLLQLCLPIPVGYPAHDNWIVGIAHGMGRVRIKREVLQYYRRHEENESQLIVNGTVRVTRWDVFISNITNSIARVWAPATSSRGSGNAHCFPISLMLDWAAVAVRTAPEQYISELEQFRSELEKHIEAMKKRRSIQHLTFPRRAIKGIRYWCEGGYSSFSGVKSLLRDIIAP